MKNDTPLPGLDFLISRLTMYDEHLELKVPDPNAPKTGDIITGVHLDPVLAKVYSRCNGGMLGDLWLTEYTGLAMNTVTFDLEDKDKRVKELFCYSGHTILRYEYATIPILANSEGIQPVVQFNLQDDSMPILPVASNVDRAFLLYGLYCEKRHKAGGSLKNENETDVWFPYSMVKEIAQDRPFVEMLEAGRFDMIVRPYDQEEDRKWFQEILNEARKLR